VSNQNQHPDPRNELLVVENDKFKQTIAHMKQAAIAEIRSSTLNELRSRLDTAEKRNQLMGNTMATSMNELISERKSG
jgi:hypothetical protein